MFNNNNYGDIGECEIGVAEIEADLTTHHQHIDPIYAKGVNPAKEKLPDIELIIDQNCTIETSGNANKCCIEVNDVCINYSNKKIVENVSLNIMRNSITAIIGPSGCGKSSFLCCLNKLTDLIPNCEVSGGIRFDWNPAAYSSNSTQLRRHVGMLFQKPNPFPFSIWRNLEFPLKEHGISDPKEIAKKIEAALTDVGLWEEIKDRLDESALELSGGQQQRLCLARALVLEPSIMLMDEPCSALDPMATKKIEELTKSLSKKMTVILVTHNLSQARRVADHVALFWKEGNCGKLIEYSPVKEFFEAPQHELTKSYLAYG